MNENNGEEKLDKDRFLFYLSLIIENSERKDL